MVKVNVVMFQGVPQKVFKEQEDLVAKELGYKGGE